VEQLTPNIILRGGPVTGFTSELVQHHVPETESVFKLDLGNRREHFVPTPETELHDGVELRVFQWLQTTYVAE
jgi:hypothetical protein